ncbi:uncharacterized protein TNCV_1200441 [Trichonephila clavipes]|uniref:Uncharacterized protein n=1 Tax=Trichonephila clavipes TaxID=2585209 RepID=A0A8X6S974_TRICX|nr:uncharacterized protein TNCV_1200441 [Trichonephila clavipes]
MLPEELHQLKYEALSVPQGSVRLVKKTQERKSSTCDLLITKGVTSSSPVPLKTRRRGVTGVILTLISYFKVSRMMRGDKDQQPDSYPSSIQTEMILLHVSRLWM